MSFLAPGGLRRCFPLPALLFSLLTIAPAARAADELSTTGTWAIESWTKQADSTEYWLSLRWSRNSDHWGSHSLSLDRVPGLTAAQITGSPASVHFEIKRDAGTFVCDGRVGSKEGAGLYDLQLDPKFADALSKRGIGRPSREQQIRFAISDVSFAFLDELSPEVPSPTSTSTKLAGHGVDKDTWMAWALPAISSPATTTCSRTRPRRRPALRAGHERRGLPNSAGRLLRARLGVDARYIRAIRDAGSPGCR
jgi:hypothetical protein